MTRRLRATLRGVWWRAYMKTIRHCQSCGGALVKKYVPAEKRRRLVCGKCARIAYLNPKVVAGLIPVMPDGRVALLRRDIEPAKGKWTFPAGYQELGESVEEAAARETREEICLNVKIAGPLGIYSYADAGVVTIVYVGHVRRGERPEVGEEAQEVGLFKAAEIPWKDLAFRSTIEAMEHWLKWREQKIWNSPSL